MIDGGKGVGGGEPEGGRASRLRRLVDESGGDPGSTADWAVDLLRKTGPYRPPVGRKQRVRMGLGREQEQDGKRRRSAALRPAIAAAILVGCGAAASAALGHWPTLVSDAYRRLVSPSPAVAPAIAEARPPGVASGHARRDPPVKASAPAAGAAAIVEPSPSPSAPAPRREPIATARTSARTSPRSPAPAAAEDTSPVLEAMRALRLEENPARARRLLARYLARHPSGALAEEAQAMTIEAAVAHHDADAAALARRYLRRYPAGHFSALARQTLAHEPRQPPDEGTRAAP